MKHWLENFYIAQQAIETANTAAEVGQALRDILLWLFGEEASVRLWQDLAPEELSPLAQEAAATLRPQTNEDGTEIALPLRADGQTLGLVVIETPAPPEAHKIGLASSLVHIAALSLARLTWPASSQIFRQLVENANVAINVVDLQGKIAYANLAAAQLYGFSAPDELAGRSASDLYFADEELRIAADLNTKTRTQEGWTGDVTHRHVDGGPLPVRLAVFSLRDHQNRLTGYGAIIQSLGEQQRLLLSLTQQTRRLRAAAEVARATASKLDLKALLSQVAMVTQDLFNLDLVSIALVEGGRLVIRMVYSERGRLVPHNPELPIDDTSLSGWVVLRGQAALVNELSRDWRHRPLADMPETRSALVMPMRLGDRVIGTLDVQSKHLNAFQPADAEALQSIADQLAAAVENVWLFEAERTQIRQLAALNTISQALVAANNLEAVWDTIYDQIAGLFNVSTFYVMGYDAETDRLHFLRLVINGQVTEPEPPYKLAGLSSLIIRTGEPLLLYDLPAQRDWLREQGVVALPIWGKRDARSWMGAPLRARDGTIMGLISVQSNLPNVFNESDKQLLATIAIQLSLGMENASLFQRLHEAATKLKERARRVESLYRIGTLLSTSLDRDRILTLAAEQIVRLLNVDHCGILLLDDSGTVAHLVAEYPATTLLNTAFSATDNPLLDLYQEQDLFICDDVEEDPRLEPVRDALRERNIRTLLIVRLAVKGQPIGAIELHTFEQPRKFTGGEIETCLAFATQVSLAVDNSTLYGEALTANKLKSQFLATMSHELRTPLNAIMGYTEMVTKGVYGPLSEKQHDRLQRVYVNAQHLLELINDVLDLAKIESGRMTLSLEPTDVRALVSGVIAAIAPQAEAKGLKLDTLFSEALPIVNVDSMRLRQIITNLMSNAVKFTHRGGITLRMFPLTVAGGSGAEKALSNLPVDDGRWLAVEVEDTGIGIAPENFKIIFDAFRQVDGSTMREYQGTGLGLAITRQLVEMHGGRLWLESEVGKGSTFRFVLPVSDNPPVPASSLTRQS